MPVIFGIVKLGTLSCRKSSCKDSINAFGTAPSAPELIAIIILADGKRKHKASSSHLCLHCILTSPISLPPSRGRSFSRWTFAPLLFLSFTRARTWKPAPRPAGAQAGPVPSHPCPYSAHEPQAVPSSEIIARSLSAWQVQM